MVEIFQLLLIRCKYCALKRQIDSLSTFLFYFVVVVVVVVPLHSTEIYTFFCTVFFFCHFIGLKGTMYAVLKRYKVFV